MQKKKGGRMKYKLSVCETVTKSHDVIIDTDRPIDEICSEIEGHTFMLMNIYDIQYLDGVICLDIIEDEDGTSEFEVESIDDDEVAE